MDHFVPLHIFLCHILSCILIFPPLDSDRWALKRWLFWNMWLSAQTVCWKQITCLSIHFSFPAFILHVEVECTSFMLHCKINRHGWEPLCIKVRTQSLVILGSSTQTNLPLRKGPFSVTGVTNTDSGTSTFCLFAQTCVQKEKKQEIITAEDDNWVSCLQ